ncbi:NADPH-dependent F420 reductase [Streptomyces sp. NBC_00572]|uniref:NADPH-dependent F420 reductase n=1 Tax=Streptomyces sp. NBC_00572 TaxID=2903664 RepID=UPI002254EB2E|nr:NAD(P)-binding domain-containing protein [Streptomyces sp. NBC_00572]MCX4986238.1 NAD(P)-binding domain-containing protein [Streptomyces sp. NBC_00572]
MALMRIGILGTGHVGQALASAWARAGHDVVIGSRRPDDPELLAKLKELTATGLRVDSCAGAAAHAEVLVNATPGTASVALLHTIGARALAGRIILDVGVGFLADGSLSHPDVSLGEEIQQAFPETRVVKTLCTIDRKVMIAPDSLEGPGTVFLSGEDAEAKKAVGGLVADLGWSDDSLLDLGGIVTARGQEHFALLFTGIARATGTYEFGIRVVLPTSGGSGLDH